MTGKTCVCKGCGGSYFTWADVYVNEDFCEDCVAAETEKWQRRFSGDDDA